MRYTYIHEYARKILPRSMAFCTARYGEKQQNTLLFWISLIIAGFSPECVCAIFLSLSLVLWYELNEKFWDILFCFPIPDCGKRKPTWRLWLWWLANLAWYKVTWKPSILECFSILDLKYTFPFEKYSWGKCCIYIQMRNSTTKMIQPERRYQLQGERNEWLSDPNLTEQNSHQCGIPKSICDLYIDKYLFYCLMFYMQPVQEWMWNPNLWTLQLWQGGINVQLVFHFSHVYDQLMQQDEGTIRQCNISQTYISWFICQNHMGKKKFLFSMKYFYICVCEEFLVKLFFHATEMLLDNEFYKPH